MPRCRIPRSLRYRLRVPRGRLPLVPVKQHLRAGLPDGSPTRRLPRGSCLTGCCDSLTTYPLRFLPDVNVRFDPLPTLILPRLVPLTLITIWFCCAGYILRLAPFAGHVCVPLPIYTVYQAVVPSHVVGSGCLIRSRLRVLTAFVSTLYLCVLPPYRV